MGAAHDNPYESPHTQRTSHSRSLILERLLWTPIGALVGVGMGGFGGWFVWHFIYSIGSSVITDEMFARYVDDVCSWSAIVGLVTGAFVGFAFVRRAVLALVAQHGVGIAAGMFCAGWGWQYGLAGYFAGQLAGIAVAAVNLLPRKETEE